MEEEGRCCGNQEMERVGSRGSPTLSPKGISLDVGEVCQLARHRPSQGKDVRGRRAQNDITVELLEESKLTSLEHVVGLLVFFPCHAKTFGPSQMGLQGNTFVQIYILLYIFRH